MPFSMSFYKYTKTTTFKVVVFGFIIPQSRETLRSWSIVFAIIDKMLTTKKFKDFFNNNAALL